jgi:uncharacterized membrane protein (DUF2068 family)
VFERHRAALRRSLWWHPETLVCARRGHVTPASSVARLLPEDAGLGVDLADGRRMSRCIRCDVWVAGPVPVAPVSDRLPPLADLPLPRRGEELREAIIIRLISIDRAVHAVVFGLVATLVFAVELNLGGLQAQAHSLLDGLRVTVAQTGQEPQRGFLARELVRLLGLSSHVLLVLAVTAAGYCVLEAVEAVGLWRERRWAEYLTAVATAGFLPFEVHELLVRVTALRVGALIVNLAVLVWLVRRKRLFGIGGGVAALRHEEIDRQALFGPPPFATVDGGRELRPAAD